MMLAQTRIWQMWHESLPHGMRNHLHLSRLLPFLCPHHHHDNHCFVYFLGIYDNTLYMLSYCLESEWDDVRKYVFIVYFFLFFCRVSLSRDFATLALHSSMSKLFFMDLFSHHHTYIWMNTLLILFTCMCR